MQKVQYLLQPSMIETKAVGPSARGAGRLSNFSISGQRMSTAGLGGGGVSCRQRPRARLSRRRGQAVQGLRAEYQVHQLRALRQRLAFLAGHAAADADDAPGLG